MDKILPYNRHNWTLPISDSRTIVEIVRRIGIIPIIPSIPSFGRVPLPISKGSYLVCWRFPGIF